MKNIFLTLIFACACSIAFAASPPADLLPSFAAVSADAGDDMKKLILKYDAAPAAEKSAVRKEIEALAKQEETAQIQKTDERLKRQEAQVKELKKTNEERRKNINSAAAKWADYLISKESIEKVKNEPIKQKITDKVKSKK